MGRIIICARIARDVQRGYRQKVSLLHKLDKIKMALAAQLIQSRKSWRFLPTAVHYKCSLMSHLNYNLIFASQHQGETLAAHFWANHRTTFIRLLSKRNINSDAP